MHYSQKLFNIWPAINLTSDICLFSWTEVWYYFWK